jgi:hypothetical protein
MNSATTAPRGATAAAKPKRGTSAKPLDTAESARKGLTLTVAQVHTAIKDLYATVGGFDSWPISGNLVSEAVNLAADLVKSTEDDIDGGLYHLQALLAGAAAMNSTPPMVRTELTRCVVLIDMVCNTKPNHHLWEPAAVQAKVEETELPPENVLKALADVFYEIATLGDNIAKLGVATQDYDLDSGLDAIQALGKQIGLIADNGAELCRAKMSGGTDGGFLGMRGTAAADWLMPESFEAAQESQR